MKISINSKIIPGPFGGGMQFVNYLREFLEKNHHKVVFDLADPDIDIILHIAAFPLLFQNAKYSLFDANIYQLKHPNCKIIARINECDERKGTHYINNLYALESYFSDYTVYISDWLKSLYLNRYKFLDPQKAGLIRNGADEKIFHPGKSTYKGGKLKIVTHHWSSHYLKGHDIYQAIDRLLDDPVFSKDFEFTYIGNKPKHIHFKNTNLIKPLSGVELASELRKHHVYVTGTRNEPAGMHHIEGAMCGLPVLYVNSGATPEFAGKFGLEINLTNLKSLLFKMKKNFASFRKQMAFYPYTAEKMANDYTSLFTQTLEKSPNLDYRNELFLIPRALLYGFANLLLNIYTGIIYIGKETRSIFSR